MVRFDFGLCRHCGKGRIIKMWGGIQPQFHCTQCGIVTGYGGRPDRSMPLPEIDLKNALDQTFIALNQHRVMLGPFMETLRYVLGVTPTFKVDDLHRYGYNISHGYIERYKDE